MKVKRQALRAAEIPGWEVLYDAADPRHAAAGTEYLRHIGEGTAPNVYALWCVKHRLARVLAHFHEDRELISSGAWCVECVKTGGR